MHAGLTAAIIAAVTATAAQARQWTVEGRVIEAGSRAPIGGARVELSGRLFVQTSNDGRFRFESVASGRYALSVQALGWATQEGALVVQRDTTLVIELERTPVQLDTLAVEARSISVRGVVTARASGLKLYDVEVVAPPDRRTRTDPIGRFRFRNVPANTPFVLHARELGFLIQSVAVVASRDTTVSVEMEADPVTERAIEIAKQRLAERAEPRSFAGVPAITRTELLRNLNRSVLEVINEMLRGRRLRITCYVIDEQRALLGEVLLETMLPDQVEHIDILEFGPARTSLMARVYTRDYFPTVMARGPDVLSPASLMTAARSGNCR